MSSPHFSSPPSTQLWIWFQAMIANGLYNFDSQRFQKASLSPKRAEGWTETWGSTSTDDNDDANVHNDSYSTATAPQQQPLIFEDTTHSIWVQVDDDHNTLTMVLTQYRPAWLEQLVLKLAHIPYVVVNSTYACHEATGPLPFVRDNHNHHMDTILVGRHHPTNIPLMDSQDNPLPSFIRDNSILSYLYSYREVDIDRQADLSKVQQALGVSLMQMIQSELQPLLMYLRYCDDDAWNQVYRRQYIQASCPKIGSMKKNRSNTVTGSWFLQVHGRVQAHMERAVQRKRLLEVSRRVCNIRDAVQRATFLYQALETQLAAQVEASTNKIEDSQQRTNNTYLLGSASPALVDAFLWAHLAEAFGDIHLIVVLASCPHLIQYFQSLYQEYFSTKTTKTSRWEVWNDRQNLENAFQQIPTLAMSKKNNPITSSFQSAIDLMQSLSLQTQDLKELLTAVRAKRETEPWPEPKQSSNDSLLYRWSMGEDIFDESKRQHGDDSEQKNDNPLRKQMMREQQRNDQRWISGVVGVSLAAILLLQAGATASE